MQKTFPYISPITERLSSQFHVDDLQQALDIFNSGQEKEAFLKTLDIIRPDTCKKYGNAEQTLFLIPHGSVQLEVRVSDIEYTIRLPFVRLGEKNQMAQLRQVLQFNSARLTLAQILLEGDELFFFYSAPLSLSHPYKLWSVFYQMCWTADQQDDIFSEKFGATPLSETPKKEFSKEHQDAAWELFQKCLQEGKEYASFMETKRYSDLAVFGYHIALMKIDIVLNPQGYLRSHLFQAVSQVSDYSVSPNELLPKVKKLIKEFEEFDRETFIASLYTPEFFVSFEPLQDIATVKNILQKDYDILKTDIAKNQYDVATIFAFKLLYDLCYRYTLPAPVHEIIINALKESSDQPWRDSAHILVDAMGAIMNLEQDK